MYKIHGIASGAVNVSPNFPPGSSSVNWVATRDVQPLFLLIQIFGNNTWNRINFRNTSFQVPALFDTAAPVVPNSWWGRQFPEGPEACRCAFEIISLRQFVWNLYSASVEADIGISFICGCWFSDLNSVSQHPAYGFWQDKLKSDSVQIQERSLHPRPRTSKPLSKPQKVYSRG